MLNVHASEITQPCSRVGHITVHIPCLLLLTCFACRPTCWLLALVCSEYDMINNYKVLQETFNRLNVDKYIEVSRTFYAVFAPVLSATLLHRGTGMLSVCMLHVML